MLSWANRWKIGIYQSMRRAKLISLRLTRPIWRLWNPDRQSEPGTKVDRSRITNSKQRKYKTARITTKLKVTNHSRSTSKAQDYKERHFSQKLISKCVPKVYTPVMNAALFGDAFNN